MKNLLITLFLIISLPLLAQTDGISYQAVIVGPDNQELPGVDAEGNILPNATVAIRFTIIDQSNTTEYQEVQTTNTDQYGRINLIIGQVNPNGFAQIRWDGTNKDLKVEIDFSGGTNYVDMAREKLTFLPYAFHRNITATGTLTVDDLTFLNGELQVEGPANLNSTLNVNGGNATNLSGDLTVEGNTNLNNDLLIIGGLEVEGSTILNNTLTVNNQAPTYLSGDLTVVGEAVLGDIATDNLIVENYTELRGDAKVLGKLKINSSLAGTGLYPDYSINSYPFLIEGSSQGMAIKVDGSRTIANNYISFWDDDQMWGRIEGQSIDDLENEEFYEIEKAIRVWDLGYAYYGNAKSGWQLGSALAAAVAAFSSSTGCVGVGACVTVPIISLIVDALVKVVLAIADAVQSLITTFNAADKLIEFEEFKQDGIGITFSSGAGDYAEWLPKQKMTDKFVPGELVGIKNGLITKNIMGADKIMAVSTRPFILGNMPDPSQEKNNVKIAFMGQVPVRVIGKVEPGDYILPTEFGSGFGVAIHPKEMQTRDYKRIVGVVWNIIGEVKDGLTLANVAVGLNMNDMSDLVYEQEKAILELRKEANNLQLQIDQTNKVLSKLVPDFAETLGISTDLVFDDLEEKKTEIENHNDLEEIYLNGDFNDILYFELSDAEIENIIEIARSNYLQLLNDKDEKNKLLLGGDISLNDKLENIKQVEIKDHFFWQKIDSDISYKKEIVKFIKDEMDKIIHTHRKYENEFTEIKLRKN